MAGRRSGIVPRRAGRDLAQPTPSGPHALQRTESDFPVRCPLCDAPDAAPFAEVDDDRYHRCAHCLLTFLPPSAHPDAAEERARYETHENHPDDPGYRAFLERLAGPLSARLAPGMVGLDYGAGPGPTLSVMLAERGFPTAVWDPYFAPDPSALERRYDFVTCTETAEHFFRPGDEFRRLDGLLRSPGWLGVMTEVLEDDAAFPGWWYVRDPTHVCFYRPETLTWLAATHGWALERPSRTVALFRKG